MNIVDSLEDFDYRLKLGNTLIAGPTGSGKTWLFARLLKNWHYYADSPEIGLLVICYKVWQPIYREIISSLPEGTQVKLFSSFPSELGTAEFYDIVPEGKCSVVLVDDAHSTLASKRAEETLTSLICVLSHHRSVWTFFIVQ